MKLVAVATMVIAIFVGISHVGSDKADPSKLVINSTGFNNAFADSLGWQGVRSIATLSGQHRKPLIRFTILYTDGVCC